MGGKCDDEGDLNCAHLFPRDSGYKRGSDIMVGDITYRGQGEWV